MSPRKRLNHIADPELRVLVESLAVLRVQQGRRLLRSCSALQIRKLNFIIYTAILQNSNRIKYASCSILFSPLFRTFSTAMESSKDGSLCRQMENLKEKDVCHLFAKNINAIKQSLYFFFIYEGYKTLPNNVLSLEKNE
jgi:hypothetical protein